MAKKNLATIIKTLDLSGKNVIIEDDILCHRIQNKLLEVLDDIMLVCSENNIRWQMSGGSALGTIRHQGFIPWDDDIDINMERSELDRFLPIFKERFSDKYWIYIPRETPGYDYQMIHIMTKDVTARTLMESSDLPSGLCVDIFPVENVPDNKMIRLIHGTLCMGFRYVLSCFRFKANMNDLKEIAPNNDELEKIARKRIRLASFFEIIDKNWWIKMADQTSKLCKNNSSIMVSIPAGSKKYFGEMYLRSKFCNVKEGVFEGRTVPIAEDIDGYMTTLYGPDYMVIPDKKDRGQHVLLELDFKEK